MAWRGNVGHPSFETLSTLFSEISPSCETPPSAPPTDRTPDSFLRCFVRGMSQSSGPHPTARRLVECCHIRIALETNERVMKAPSKGLILRSFCFRCPRETSSFTSAATRSVGVYMSWDASTILRVHLPGYIYRTASLVGSSAGCSFDPPSVRNDGSLSPCYSQLISCIITIMMSSCPMIDLSTRL